MTQPDKHEVHALYLRIERDLPNEKRKVAKDIIRRVLIAQQYEKEQRKLDEPN